MIAFLESRRIAARLLSGGNLTRHPAYQGANFRVAGELINSDIVTERTFWVGVRPRLTAEMVDYLAATSSADQRRTGYASAAVRSSKTSRAAATALSAAGKPA